MRNRAFNIFAVALLISLAPMVCQALTPYSQDFEGLVQSSPNALANDGWLVYGNVFSPDGAVWLYGYGPYPAPNDGSGFCQIALGEGGPDQGAQQLSTFSDYENVDHAKLYIIEANIFHEQTIEAADVGQTWVFAFQAKLGNIEGASTAAAFIKTLDPASGYAMTNFITADMTNTPLTWTPYSLSIDIDAGLEGQILQIGFVNTATNYEGSGIFYDNVDWDLLDPTAVPGRSEAAGITLRQNYPNPFNPSTKIEFALENTGFVEVALFDLAGRLVATLQQGELGPGEHAVIWDGRTAAGGPAPSGQYRYVLRTESGQLSRTMLLLK